MADFDGHNVFQLLGHRGSMANFKEKDAFETQSDHGGHGSGSESGSVVASVNEKVETQLGREQDQDDCQAEMVMSDSNDAEMICQQDGQKVVLSDIFVQKPYKNHHKIYKLKSLSHLEPWRSCKNFHKIVQADMNRRCQILVLARAYKELWQSRKVKLYG